MNVPLYMYVVYLYVNPIEIVQYDFYGKTNECTMYLYVL